MGSIRPLTKGRLVCGKKLDFICLVVKGFLITIKKGNLNIMLTNLFIILIIKVLYLIPCLFIKTLIKIPPFI